MAAEQHRIVTLGERWHSQTQKRDGQPPKKKQREKELGTSYQVGRGGTTLQTQLATAGAPTVEINKKYPTVKDATSITMNVRNVIREMMSVSMQLDTGA